MSETMMTKHEIEIPDLPDGWRAVAFREPRLGEHYLSGINTVIRSNFNNCGESNLIIEKIKPRRIVLEDTQGDMPVDEDNTDWIYHDDKTRN